MPDLNLDDLDVARGLASPLRQRMMQMLGEGEQTSTTLAARLGVTTGATSYHLRELARFGLVEETTSPDGAAGGRRRWWRRTTRGLRLPVRSAQSPELRGVLDDLQAQWIDRDVASFRQFLAHRDDLGEWADALPFSRGNLVLTSDGLRAFFEDYLALLARYQSDAVPTAPDARRVLVRFVAFPDVPDAPEDESGPA